MKTYTIIGGVNGTGKSSLTGVLLAKDTQLGTVIDTDKITKQIGGDKIKGGKAAIQKINYCLEKGLNFTQETTLAGTRTLKTIKKAIDLDYRINLYYVGVNSFQESIIRIANRVSKGGHNIPDDDVIRRYHNRCEDLCRVMPYCSEVYFFDNENGFVQIAEYKNGEIFTLVKNPPEWFENLKKYLQMN